LSGETGQRHLSWLCGLCVPSLGWVDALFDRHFQFFTLHIQLANQPLSEKQ
jgi:hypothetical protein